MKMRFVLSESEALWIEKKFGFSKLLGLNAHKLIKFGTEKAVIQRGISYLNNGRLELSTEYRVLFSAWEKMRYTIVRPDLNTRKRLQCILSNEKKTMFFSRDLETITIDLIDFSETALDRMIQGYAELHLAGDARDQFNINMTTDEYDEFINCREYAEFLNWQRVLGIDATVLSRYVDALNAEDNTQMLLVEDHEMCVGYMAKIVNRPDGIYAVKHVTRGEEEKMVLLLGDVQYVTDSIYNF